MKPTRQRAYQDAIFVRLFRLWAMGWEEGASALPAMHAEATKHGYKDQAAAACSSLFELVEGHLGRKLVRECCCSPRFSSDEKALLGILRTAPAITSHHSSREVPHGLPGAISWAASCVCDAMNIPVSGEEFALRNSAANNQSCPFDQQRDEGAAHGL